MIPETQCIVILTTTLLTNSVFASTTNLKRLEGAGTILRPNVLIK